MIVYINTTEKDIIEVALKEGVKIVDQKKIKAPRKQAEKLLPLLAALLVKAEKKLKDIKKIEVENRGGSFTSLRIGVVTANALGYALGLPVTAAGGETKTFSRSSLAVPIYDREPEIGVKKAPLPVDRPL